MMLPLSRWLNSNLGILAHFKVGDDSGELGGVVGIVSGAAALGLADVGLDQLAPVVDAHQLRAQADFHLLARRAQGGRNRIESVLVGHVMIGVPLGGAPVGDLVGLAVPATVMDVKRLRSVNAKAGLFSPWR